MKGQILIPSIAIVLAVCMIKIFIKFMVSSDGESPKQLVERLRAIGGVPLVGQYDVEIPLGETERLFPKLEAIHRALKGSGTYYTVSTGLESEQAAKGDLTSVESRAEGDQKMAELKKKMYRAKLARWREMGIDTASLEELLETDIEGFKAVSRTYLREHLDKTKVIEDVARDLKNIDEEVCAQIDDLGVSLENICKLCNLNENEAILSLGRLISAGKVTWLTKDDKEVYVRVAPHRAAAIAVEEGLAPAKSKEEAEERVLSALRVRGNTVRQVCQESRLPEGQVMNALADLLKSGRVRSARRGKSTVYLRVPGARS